MASVLTTIQTRLLGQSDPRDVSVGNSAEKVEGGTATLCREDRGLAAKYLANGSRESLVRSPTKQAQPARKEKPAHNNAAVRARSLNDIVAYCDL